MKRNLLLDLNNPANYAVSVNSREEMLVDSAAHSKNASYAVTRPNEDPRINLRDFNLKDYSFRSPFHIDSDMITYSKYALKLNGKTQIFISPNDSQLLTRASHTEIVVNLADSIARSLSLNEDLTRSISKGHDIGHTAFGHAGEDELEQICQEEYCYCDVDTLRTKDKDKYAKLEIKYGFLNDVKLKQVPVLERILNEKYTDNLKREFFVQPNDKKIFSHAKQSFRLLCILEGKKLTAQTVHGIISHGYSWSRLGDWKINQTEILQRPEDPNPLKQQNPAGFIEEHYEIGPEHQTYEGQVVKFADFLAFAIHDLDDVLRAEKINLDDLKGRFNDAFPKLNFDEYLSGPNRYSRYISQFFEENKENVRTGAPNLVKPSEAKNILGWIKENIIQGLIHQDKEIQRKHSEGRRYIRGLFDVWKKPGEELQNTITEMRLVPEINTQFIKGYSQTRQFCDFISALTDAEIIKVYRNFYGPEQ